MKKVILCVCVCFLAAFKPVSADETSNRLTEAVAENAISSIYNQIDFSACDQLSFEAFSHACRGYMNLRQEGKLSGDRNIITICDFSLSSTANRLWVIDLDNKKVLFNTYVAHGEGSGDEYAEDFSNDENSHQSSLGFYVTGAPYSGEHGTSLRLYGMDNGYNDAAFDRGIVVHGADYVCSKFISMKQRLGRSWGCPAVPAKMSAHIINAIQNGTCLFIYYPDKKYLSQSYWLNKKDNTLAGNSIIASASPQAIMKAAKATGTDSVSAMLLPFRQ